MSRGRVPRQSAVHGVRGREGRAKLNIGGLAGAVARPMRFWVHHESDPEFALSVEWADGDARTVAALRDTFAAALARAHPTSAPPAASLQLGASDGTRIPLDSCVVAAVCDGDDVYATVACESHVSTAPPNVLSPSGAPSVAASASAVASGLPEALKARKKLPPALKPYFEAADEAWRKRSYRQARTIYTELLELDQNALPARHRSLARRRLGEIELHCGRENRAVEHLRLAVDADESVVESHLGLGKAYAAAGRHADAVPAIQRALKLVHEPKEVRPKLEHRNYKHQRGGAVSAACVRFEPTATPPHLGR